MVATPLGVRPRSAGTSGGADAGTASRAQPLRGGRAHRRLGGAVGERWPTGRARSAPTRCGQLAELLCGEQGRVVLRMALGGKSVALDRVREDHRRTSVVDRAERVRRGPDDRGRRGCGSPHVTGRRRRRRSVSGSRPRPDRHPAAGHAACAASQRSRRWYSGLLMASMRARSASPPGRANSSLSR